MSIKSALKRPRQLNQKSIIGAIMFATGKSVEEVAKEHNYSKNIIYRTIARVSRGAKTRALLATITGLSENELWPEQTEKGES